MKKRSKKLLVIWCCAVVCGCSAAGAQTDAQPGQMSPDRPGKSSTPVTVDAGHFQLEADLFNYAEGPSFNQSSAPNAVLKLGISRTVDLEVAFSGANHLAVKGEGNINGIGDTWIGAKFSIFGQAFAIIPFIKIPTAVKGLGNSKIEYTVALPYQLSLPYNWGLTIENADGLRADHNAEHYVGDYQGIINLSHPLLWDSLTASIEYAYDYNADPAIGHGATFDPSLQWFVKPNLALTLKPE